MNLGHFLRGAVVTVMTSLLMNAAHAIAPTKETMRIAVHLGAMRDVSRADVEVSMKVWANELMAALEVPAEVNLYADLPDIRRDMASGRVNFVIADPISFIRNFALDELADGFGAVGVGEDSMVLIARKSLGISGLSDLRGKRVVLLSESEVPDLWLEVMCVRTFKRSCERASLDISQEKLSQRQVLKVFFGKADVALVRSRSFEIAADLNPQLRQQLAVVTRVPLYPGAIGLFSSSVSREFRDYVMSKVSRFDREPRARQIMEILRNEQVGRISKQLLEPIQLLLVEHAAFVKRESADKTK